MKLYAFLCICLAVILLTQNPFLYRDFIAQGWEWEVQGADVFQNIVLFAPVGALFQLIFKRRFWAACLFGFCFSLLIETGQLYINNRATSFIDLGVNTIGAGLGSLVANRVRGWLANEDLAALAILLLPAVWVGAINAHFYAQHVIILLGLVGPCFLICLITLQKYAKINAILISGSLSLLICLFSFKIGVSALGTVILLAGLTHFCGKKLRHFALGLIFVSLVLLLGLSFFVNEIWTLEEAAYPWRILTHFRWMELVFLAMPAIGAAICLKKLGGLF